MAKSKNCSSNSASVKKLHSATVKKASVAPVVAVCSIAMLAAGSVAIVLVSILKTNTVGNPLQPTVINRREIATADMQEDSRSQSMDGDESKAELIAEALTCDRSITETELRDMIAIIEGIIDGLRGYSMDVASAGFQLNNVIPEGQVMRGRLMTLIERNEETQARLMVAGNLGRGSPGDPGPPGKRGKIGPPGPPGDVGVKGDMGSVGIHGPEGARGPTGRKGYKGVHGSLGFSGRTGAPGQRGAEGQKGKKGVRGSKGAKGQRGKR